MAPLVPTTVDELFTLYQRQGHRTHDEGVTLLEHALQFAVLATDDGATRELITAALFQGVGWFLTDDQLHNDEATRNGGRAALGARILSPLFGPGVA